MGVNLEKKITEFKTWSSILVLLFFATIILCSVSNYDGTDFDPWKKAAMIEKNIVKTSFPNKNYNIKDFGANGDGIFNNSVCFKKAIEKCSKDGGGKVLVPKGKYLTGPIVLENNVNLHLEAGAEILFSTNPKEYYPLVHTSFEGTELMNYSPLIYAYKKKNIAVTGKGILNGQASNDNWWSWCGKDTYGWRKGMPSQNDANNRFRLVDMAEKGIPVNERVFGDGSYLRPNFIEFFECDQALLKDIKIINAPFWIIHPIKSSNVILENLNIVSHGPNNDGCDPEYSKKIIINNCIFNTGDDCIAIKSGRDADGRRVAIKSEDIIVKNCTMFDGHGGLTIGSEISAGVSNIFVENCEMNSKNLDKAIRFKTNSRRGGLIENVYVRNLKIGQVKETLLKIDMLYSVYGGDGPGNFTPKIQNIYIENVHVKYAGKYAIDAQGLKESPAKNIFLKNVTIDKVDSLYLLKHVENLNFINTHINGALIENKKNDYE